MYTYIKYKTVKKYITLEEKLPEDCYDIGTTFDDYLNDKFVLLSKEQLKFHEENPNASIEEVFNIKLKEYILTFEEIKEKKLELLNEYDNSSEVNSFTINGIITTWFKPDIRSNYANSVNSAKILNKETLDFFVEGNRLTVPTQKAEIMLAMINLYADECFIVTQQHKSEIEKLQTVEEIENYDFTTNYPNKLNFDI